MYISSGLLSNPRILLRVGAYFVVNVEGHGSLSLLFSLPASLSLPSYAQYIDEDWII